MRVLIQRVSEASVEVEEKIVGNIGQGLLVFVGIELADDVSDIVWLSQKIVNLRIFSDAAGLMNRSVLDVGGSILLVSQFTLHAATKKGNRPSYTQSARPELALVRYEQMMLELGLALGKPVETGIFGADMKVRLLNDGPVTIWIDSKNKE